MRSYSTRPRESRPPLDSLSGCAIRLFFILRRTHWTGCVAGTPMGRAAEDLIRAGYAVGGSAVTSDGTKLYHVMEADR